MISDYPIDPHPFLELQGFLDFYPLSVHILFFVFLEIFVQDCIVAKLRCFIIGSLFITQSYILFSSHDVKIFWFLNHYSTYKSRPFSVFFWFIFELFLLIHMVSLNYLEIYLQSCIFRESVVNLVSIFLASVWSFFFFLLYKFSWFLDSFFNGFYIFIHSTKYFYWIFFHYLLFFLSCFAWFLDHGPLFGISLKNQTLYLYDLILYSII